MTDQPQLVYTSSKEYNNFPTSHRQWRHEGNCSKIHGYSRSFKFVFGCHVRDKCGFVVDYGDLKWLKSFLDYWYDHTLLIAHDDPEMELLKEAEKRGICTLRIQDTGGAGMEDTAEFLFHTVSEEISARTKGRAWLISVEARENDKNASKVENIVAQFTGWRNDKNSNGSGSTLQQ